MGILDNVDKYASFNKDNQAICDKCESVASMLFLFPHKQGLCMLCKSCCDEEIALDNMLEIDTPVDHPNPVHYKFEDRGLI